MESVEGFVEQVQAGQIEEYIHIINTYQNPLYRYCSRLLGNKHEAEDAVQDRFVRAYEKIHMYKPSVLFSSWLYKIAYHYCLNLIRKRNIQQKFKWWFAHELTTESAEDTVGKSLFDEPLHSALKKLSVEERNLLVLRVFEEKSFAEIGEILNKSTETVKKRFGRTKIKLQQYMTEEGGRVRWSESGLLSKMKK